MAFRNPRNVPYLTVLLSSWFALGLLVIFALGVALVGILTFWGPWLETHWSLTFPTPLPMTWWYLFPLIPLGVLLLYFLKLKRRALQVPSTFLWRKSIEDLHVNSLFQWLRRNLLLILQLLFLLGVGYALADPTHNSESRGRHIILMIDNSASMAATDEAPTRLDMAKKEAHQRVDALDASDQAMIIAFSSDAQTVQSYTNSKPDLHAAIDRIEQTHRPTNVEGALALAEGQANPRQSGVDFTMPQPAEGEQAPRATDKPEGVATDVHIYSDGRFADMPDFSTGKLHLRLEMLGRSSNNAGIVSTNLVRDEEQPDQYELSVQVRNFGNQAIKDQLAVQLEVFARGGRQDRRLEPADLAARVVNETPGKEGVKHREEIPGARIPQPIITFYVKDPGNGYCRLSLVDKATGNPWKDDFALDDTAWLAITPVRRARVLRIGGANDILDAIIKAAVSQRRAVVTDLEPANFATNPTYKTATEVELFDVVIFDRCAPPSMEAMPKANTVFIGQVPPLPPQGAGLWEAMQPMQDLYVREFLHSHSLLRGIETLQGLSIFEAKAIPKDALPPRASPLLETQKDPVIWSIGRNRYTDLILTFPLVTEQSGVKNVWNTNWPRQPAGTFPLFFDNVIIQLGRYKEYEDSIRPGTPKPLEFGVPVKEVDVLRFDPPGAGPEQVVQTPGKDFIYGNTNTVGLYDVTWGENEKYRFAVNLFDLQESNIEPRTDLQIGEQRISEDQEPIRQRRELWPWFVFGALVLVLLEWVAYNRRIYV
jgi:hypothetical protein